MKELVFELLEQGASIRKISLSLGLSRNTVKKYIKNKKNDAEEAGQNEEIQGVWEKILTDLKRKRATIKQLWREHEPSKSYSAFRKKVHKIKEKQRQNDQHDVTMRRSHNPGERAEVDYADGLFLIEPETGKKQKTHLFCGVLPFSGFVFAEFSHTQRQKDFINSHTRMWHYFEGVTHYVVVDNLKSGVTKAHRFDPDVNRVYCDYGKHMGFMALPARPRTPRDKACVEATIGVIQRQLYSQARDIQFYSLEALNEYCRDYINQLNDDIMKDHGASRRERFLNEKAYLKNLPERSFEISEYKRIKVHPDCHIQLNSNYYSVPYGYVGQYVIAKICNEIIEIFTEDYRSITVHLKCEGNHQTSTNTEHYPEQKIAVAHFNIINAQKQASAIGPKTSELITFLTQEELPLKNLRRIEGILNLAKTYSNDALEYACQQALAFGKYRLAFVQQCAGNFNKLGKLQSIKTPQRDLKEAYLHQTNPSKEGEKNES
jgi:transposase